MYSSRKPTYLASKFVQETFSPLPLCRRRKRKKKKVHFLYIVRLRGEKKNIPIFIQINFFLSSLLTKSKNLFLRGMNNRILFLFFIENRKDSLIRSDYTYIVQYTSSHCIREGLSTYKTYICRLYRMRSSFSFFPIFKRIFIFVIFVYLALVLIISFYFLSLAFSFFFFKPAFFLPILYILISYAAQFIDQTKEAKEGKE